MFDSRLRPAITCLARLQYGQYDLLKTATRCSEMSFCHVSGASPGFTYVSDLLGSHGGSNGRPPRWARRVAYQDAGARDDLGSGAQTQQRWEGTTTALEYKSCCDAHLPAVHAF